MICNDCKVKEAVVVDLGIYRCPQCWLQRYTRGNNQPIDKPLNNVYAKKSIKPT